MIALCKPRKRSPALGPTVDGRMCFYLFLNKTGAASPQGIPLLLWIKTTIATTKTASLKLAPELKLSHVGVSFDFWFQGVASNSGSNIPSNASLQVDVKPTPLSSTHTPLTKSYLLYAFICFLNKKIGVGTTAHAFQY